VGGNPRNAGINATTIVGEIPQFMISSGFVEMNKWRLSSVWEHANVANGKIRTKRNLPMIIQNWAES
jgi:hypothetical protein